jgi:hypothetical protein
VEKKVRFFRGFGDPPKSRDIYLLISMLHRFIVRRALSSGGRKPFDFASTLQIAKNRNESPVDESVVEAGNNRRDKTLANNIYKSLKRNEKTANIMKKNEDLIALQTEITTNRGYQLIDENDKEIALVHRIIDDDNEVLVEFTSSVPEEQTDYNAEGISGGQSATGDDKGNFGILIRKHQNYYIGLGVAKPELLIMSFTAVKDISLLNKYNKNKDGKIRSILDIDTEILHDDTIYGGPYLGSDVSKEVLSQLTKTPCCPNVRVGLYELLSDIYGIDDTLGNFIYTYGKYKHYNNRTDSIRELVQFLSNN